MKKYVWMLLAVMIGINSCAPTSKIDATKAEAYSKMYAEKPVSILIMAPINNTNNVEAKELLYTSISRPLAEAGYYVISPLISMDVFKNESAYDSEFFIESSLTKFKEYFGVDAVIFPVIEKWAKEGVAVHTVIRYIIKSTTTNEVLFDRSCDLTLNLYKNSGGGNLLSVLGDILLTAVDVAMTDHIEAARIANQYIFNDLPYGKYSPMYMQDKELKARKQHVTMSVSR